MKHVFTILIAIIIFSCNDSDEKQAASSINNLDEKVLIDEHNKYPDSAALLEKLLEFYVKNQKNDIALTTINNALLRDSMSANLWDLKSIVAAEKGDTALSIKALERAIVILPLPDYIISLGNLYAEVGNPLALEMADALLMSDKARAEKEAFYIKGLYYRYKNEQEKSIPFFNKAITTDYNFILAYLEKGLALYDLKKYDESAAVFEQSIKVQNKFARGYYFLGQCYEKLNRMQEAIEVYQIALELDPNDDEVKDALGKLGIK